MATFHYLQQTTKKLLNLKQSVHLLTITLLNLLLPLSFLLLARLTSFQYLLVLIHSPQPTSFLFSLTLFTYPSLLLLVSFICIATLYHTSTGKKLTLISDNPPDPIITHHSKLYIAWIFLCYLQVCVGLSIEGSIDVGLFDGSAFNSFDMMVGRIIFPTRVLFFLGLHETMLCWSWTVVRPVVDDTVFGGLKEEKWVEKAGAAVSFGGLWWWRLRDEVESMVIVIVSKRELLMSIGLADFAAWGLYYLVVFIGLVKVVKGVWWAGKALICTRKRDEKPCQFYMIHEEV